MNGRWARERILSKSRPVFYSKHKDDTLWTIVKGIEAFFSRYHKPWYRQVRKGLPQARERGKKSSGINHNIKVRIVPGT